MTRGGAHTKKRTLQRMIRLHLTLSTTRRFLMSLRRNRPVPELAPFGEAVGALLLSGQPWPGGAPPSFRPHLPQWKPFWQPLTPAALRARPSRQLASRGSSPSAPVVDVGTGHGNRPRQLSDRAGINRRVALSAKRMFVTVFLSHLEELYNIKVIIGTTACTPRHAPRGDTACNLRLRPSSVLGSLCLFRRDIVAIG